MEKQQNHNTELASLNIIRSHLNAEHMRAALEEKELKLRHSFMALNITPELSQHIKIQRADNPQTTILIIDDDPFARSLIKKVYAKNAKVLTAKNALEGFKLYVKHAPDLLLLDIQMPNINGYYFLAKIFDLDPAAYVVMLSAHADDKNIDKAIKYGARGFVSKPFSPAELLSYTASINRQTIDID